VGREFKSPLAHLLSNGESAAMETVQVTRDTDKIIKDFDRWMKVDKQLSSRTRMKHVLNARRYLLSVKEKAAIDTESMRTYLEGYIGRPSYQDQLKMLRRLSQFLKHPELAESFVFPQSEIKQVITKSREEMTVFYNALPSWKLKALFLMYASSGLRNYEILSLTFDDIDFKNRMLVPKHAHETSTTKKVNHSFYNEEAATALDHYLKEERPHDTGGMKWNAEKINPETDERVFLINQKNAGIAFRDNSKRCNVRILVSDLRDFFINEMGSLNVQDRYVDFFCGRTPKSVLAKHYSDYRIEKTKPIYDKAGLRILHEPIKEESAKVNSSDRPKDTLFSEDIKGNIHEKGFDEMLH
jgi:integrase